MTAGGRCGGKAAIAAGLQHYPAEFAASEGDIAVALYTCQISGLKEKNWVGDLVLYCTAPLMEKVVVDLPWIRVKGGRAKSTRSHRFPFVSDSG